MVDAQYFNMVNRDSGVGVAAARVGEIYRLGSGSHTCVRSVNGGVEKINYLWLRFPIRPQVIKDWREGVHAYGAVVKVFPLQESFARRSPLTLEEEKSPGRR